MAFYLAPVANGLGDLIVSLPALQALINTGQPTYLVTRSPFQEGLEARIEGLAGSVRETEFESAQLKAGDTYFNLRNHPLQTDHIWASPEFERQYPGYKINHVLKGICADFGIDANYDHLTPLPFTTRLEAKDTVIFIPGSAGIVKCWPVQHWLDLAAELKSKGQKLAVLGQPERSEIVRDCLKAGLEHIPTPTIIDALDVISSAQSVVAVDTGLMHIALHQMIPTVSLFRYNVMFQRDYPHVRSLVAPLCQQSCIDIEFSAVPNKVVNFDIFKENENLTYWETWKCTSEKWEERCMSAITVESVLGAVTELSMEIKVK
ncbi:hypothetical protein BH11CYA1_BH11CYA1_16260 [soil metagenome]